MDFSLSASSFTPSSPKCPREPHTIQQFWIPSTPSTESFLLPHRVVSVGWVDHSSKSSRFVNSPFRDFLAAPQPFPSAGPRILQQLPDSSSVSVTTLSAPRRLRRNVVSGARIVHMHIAFGKGARALFCDRIAQGPLLWRSSCAADALFAWSGTFWALVRWNPHDEAIQPGARGSCSRRVRRASGTRWGAKPYAKHLGRDSLNEALEVPAMTCGK